MEEETDNLSFCLSFNSYSSDRLSEIAVKVSSESQVIHNDDDDFEFSTNQNISQTPPIFPIFNRDLLKPNHHYFRTPLRNLFQDENINNSSSSSEADELELVPPESYCVWKPTAVKKSHSTGSASKRWRFRNLLHRSNSEGKHSFVFLTENSSENRKVAGKVKAPASSASAHEEFYMRNRAVKEGDKRKSYLPYRQDLVGLFGRVDKLGPVNKAF